MVVVPSIDEGTGAILRLRRHARGAETGRS
jgi:hypothetical protein